MAGLASADIAEDGPSSAVKGHVLPLEVCDGSAVHVGSPVLVAGALLVPYS